MTGKPGCIPSRRGAHKHRYICGNNTMRLLECCTSTVAYIVRSRLIVTFLLKCFLIDQIERQQIHMTVDYMQKRREPRGGITPTEAKNKYKSGSSRLHQKRSSPRIKMMRNFEILSSRMIQPESRYYSSWPSAWRRTNWTLAFNNAGQ
jgi:hypothetical protein